jgi:hypothetical protein
MAGLRDFAIETAMRLENKVNIAGASRSVTSRLGSGLRTVTFGVVLLAVACLWLVAPPHVQAQQTRILNLNLFQQQDLRALAMGNAFGAAARGEAALQYNPAGLALYDFDLKVDASVTFMEETGSFITDTLAISSGNPSNQDVLNYLNKYDGTTQNYVLQTYPSAVFNLGFVNFGFGVGNLDVQRYTLDFQSTGVLLNDTLVVSEDRAQIGLGGVGFKLFDGKAFFGVTAKQVRYSETSQSIPFATVVAASKLDLNLQGTNYNQVTAYDAGFIYRVEWFPLLKPQWSITGYNLGGYKLTGTDQTPGATFGNTNTLEVPDTYNFGFSLQPDFGPVHILMTLELEDLGGAIKVQDANGVNQPRADEQRVHAGAEIGIWKTPTGNNVLNLRAGSNGGYLSYGAEINLFGWLRAVYTYGTENNGYKGNPTIFQFEGYQVALGFAW